MRSPDTSPDADAVQIEVYRRIGPEARLRIAVELSDLGRRLLEDGIRARHPEYGPEEVRLAAIRAWLPARLFRAAYPGAPELAP